MTPKVNGSARGVDLERRKAAAKNRRRPDRQGQLKRARATLRGLARRAALLALAATALLGAPKAARAIWAAAQGSGYFAIRGVEISGASRVSREEIERALGAPIGQSLLDYDVGRAAEALLALPYVAGAEVYRDLPDRLAVKIR